MVDCQLVDDHRPRDDFSKGPSIVGETALLTGEFNPPTVYHQHVAVALAAKFDRVVVVPRGRTRNPEAGAPPLHRAVMADLAFGHLPRTTVELSEIEDGVCSSAEDLVRKTSAGDDVWFVAPAEWLTGGPESPMVNEWLGARDFWRTGQWIVLQRPGEQASAWLNTGDQSTAPADATVEAEAVLRPPNHRVVEIEYRDASEKARRAASEQTPLTGLVPPRVAEYILRHGLYLSSSAERDTRCRFNNPTILLDVDDRNPRAVEMAREMAPSVGSDPELVVVLGGDGAMLRGIRSHWRRRLPLFGINAGHVGYLLNDLEQATPPTGELLLYQLPLLWVEFETAAGETHRGLAFNDAWVERATGQTAWLRVFVDGVVRMERVVADGMLASTAAGSTSYARAMGAPPLPFHTPLLLLVGSNVLTPSSWKSAALRIESEVFVETSDPHHRPLVGYLDGMPQGPVRSMRVRTSRIGAVELAFLPEHNPAEKLARIQFPTQEPPN